MWVQGSVESWAIESYRIAKDRIYWGLPKDGATIKLSRDYFATMRPIVDMQLERAGVRLAHVLNEVFGR